MPAYEEVARIDDSTTETSEYSYESPELSSSLTYEEVDRIDDSTTVTSGYTYESP